MKKILIIFAHPAIARSTMNRAMKATVEELDGVTVHDLYKSSMAGLMAPRAGLWRENSISMP